MSKPRRVKTHEEKVKALDGLLMKLIAVHFVMNIAKRTLIRVLDDAMERQTDGK